MTNKSAEQTMTLFEIDESKLTLKNVALFFREKMNIALPNFSDNSANTEEENSNNSQMIKSFLLGILNGIFNLEASEWNTIVEIFAAKENLNRYYANALVTGKVTIEQLKCITELIGQNKIEPIAAKTFLYGRSLEHLNYNDVAQWFALPQVPTPFLKRSNSNDVNRE